MRSLPRIAVALAAMVTVLVPFGSLEPAGASSLTLPPVRHVFIIVLENEDLTSTFSDPNPPADQRYLDQTLPRQGELLAKYYAIGHESNDNYVAMISGQAPNPLNQGDCPIYGNFVTIGPAVFPDQLRGYGCIFPSSVQTIGNQFTEGFLSWKGYMQDMGNIPLRDGGTDCGHPLVDAPDYTEVAVPGDGYATRHDPFMYFHSIISNHTYCDHHVVPLGSAAGVGSGLASDLKQISTTPNLSYIVPNLCDDGHDPVLPGGTIPSIPIAIPEVNSCFNQLGAPGGITQASAFLQQWVPIITSSPAFKRNGLLVVTFDEGSDEDTTSCCGEVPGPNSPDPGLTGGGGGLIGAVVISPYTKPDTVSMVPYNHYSLLASVENLFHLPHLGMAKTVTSVFGPDVYNNWERAGPGR